MPARDRLALAGMPLLQLLLSVPQAAGFAFTPVTRAPAPSFCRAAPAMEVASSPNATPTADEGCEPVFDLSAPAQLESLRVGGFATAPTNDAVLAALLALDDSEEAVAAFVEVNRDLVDYRFLYRLTSMKLRASNSGDEAEVAKLSAVRARAIKAAQRFDTPLFKEVAEAEQRLGGLLAMYMQGKTPAAGEIVGSAGESPKAIFAFWMVLVAAIAAWESKLEVAAVGAQAKDKILQLSEIRAVLEGDEGLMERGGVAPLHVLMATSNVLDPTTGEELRGAEERVSKDVPRRMLDEIVGGGAEERLKVIRRIGCAYCQAQRHGFQAYNPMVQRAAALYDVLLHGKEQWLDPVDTLRKERVPTSGMVKLSREAAPELMDQGVEIPLFW